MDPISAVDARDRLDALLDEVERGDEVVISRGGRTIARLVPARSLDPDAERAAASLRALRAGLAAEGIRVTAAELRELRGAGRR